MHRIYEMKLHETCHFYPFKIWRVPGGWLYSYDDSKLVPIYTFVPYNEEFMTIPEPK